VRYIFYNILHYITRLSFLFIQLLGRSIDLTSLLSQRLGSNMLKAIDTAIHVFESRNLCGVVELLHLLEINRLTHQMLSNFVVLDPFEAMYAEANNSVVSPHGRVTLHIFWELIYDFIPNYCYNSTTDRFVLAHLPQEPPERESAPKSQTVTTMLYGNKQLKEAYQSIFTLYGGFVGSIHFSALSKLLGYHGIAMLLEQLLNVISIIQTQLKPYVEALVAGLPQKCKLPFFQYGSKGVLGFYLAQLGPVIQYKDLRTDVFQAFKELGNAVIFSLLLEKALGQQEVVDILQAAPFQNLYPKPYVKDDQNMETVMKNLDQQYAALNMVSMISRYGTEQQGANARDAELLTRERLCRALSMFELVMQRIKSFLTCDPIWEGPPPANGVMSIDECQEFHRLWSAIQFAYCLPPTKGEITIEQCYGEGLQWAGCVIMTLLAQEKRFASLDFSYHLLRVHEFDGQDGNVQGIDLKQMIKRIKVYRDLNNQIFVILNKHLSSSDILQRQVREYQPPIFQATQA
ncbi:PREDICTED: cytoplasmic FMR1-interacting protein 2-like, partial [Amphimedon queenslandica]|uniref:Cytoplasmic FMR1-interacting protein n=4 Tax=Amphimedon queenslandica TaxID=400682 RepID=A0AAN0JLN3_AMPQE